MALEDLQDLLDLLVHQDRVDHLGSQVLVGVLVPLDPLGQGEIPDHPDHLDQVVHLEAKVLKGTPDLWGLKAHLDFLDLQVARDRLDRLDNRVLLVKVELRVQVVLPGPLEQLVSLDLLDNLVHLEAQEVLVNLASKDLQGHQEHQVRLGSRDPPDRLDHRDLPAKGVSQVILDLQEILEPLDLWVFLVPMVCQVLLDQLVRGGLLVLVELREVLDLLVHQDHRAPEAPMVNRASQDRSVLLEVLDTLDNKD